MNLRIDLSYNKIMSGLFFLFIILRQCTQESVVVLNGDTYFDISLSDSKSLNAIWKIMRMI